LIDMARYYLYQIEVRHPGLNKYRLIRGNEKYVVEQQAASQLAIWNETWAKKVEKEQKIQNIQQKTEMAIAVSNQAKENLSVLENILKHTLSINDAIDWNLLKDASFFKKTRPSQPNLEKIPLPPNETDSKYQIKTGLLDSIFASRVIQKTEESNKNFKMDYSAWENEKARIIQNNAEKNREYEKELRKWESEEQEFLKDQKEKNSEIDRRKEEYLSKNPDAIIEYCSLVLSNSQYPDYFPQEFDLDYNSQTKILIVDYSLPPLENIPRLKEVKYNKTKDELVETPFSDAVIKKLYDQIIYQISLRTIHELFEADVINAISSIVFNGWVRSVDKATGQEVNACIVSLQSNREEFLLINLANIDPKACFKKLKGIGSASLSGLTPIAPIITISHEDKRFIPSYEVEDRLDDSFNLAAMDWEDFEHLIRELFEEEFSQFGGEVKVTRASRDGGVDAVAFDPDPIRGGKIVIQAKRYTNTVGVSAVRDLYGTLMNEGATKGILVTTADYGSDAYDFAKGKPLTLLNGSNLLHLLEKHGHKAKIDLKEAKALTNTL
jgi:restriction system protein